MAGLACSGDEPDRSGWSAAGAAAAQARQRERMTSRAISRKASPTRPAASAPRSRRAGGNKGLPGVAAVGGGLQQILPQRQQTPEPSG